MGILYVEGRVLLLVGGLLLLCGVITIENLIIIEGFNTVPVLLSTPVVHACA